MKNFILFFLCGILISCSITSSNQSGRYTTTSTTGDFSTWSLVGSVLTSTWNIINTTGGIKYTYTVPASCGTANATYGYRTCTIGTVTCANGTSTCPTSGIKAGQTFKILEIPGAALLVQRDLSTGGKELHIGYPTPTCPNDASGTYSFIRTAVNSSEVFGLYKINTAGYTTITHAEFGFTGTALPPTGLQYVTGGGTSSGAQTTSGSCAEGAYTLMVGSSTIRASLSSTGFFVLDYPSGSGGLIGVKTTMVATINDLASKNWVGIAFQDTTDAFWISATTSAVGSNQVDITSTFSNGATPGSMYFQPLTQSTALFAAPSAYTTYNQLAAVSPQPYDFPGFFRVRSSQDNMIALATRLNNKTLVFGTLYDARSSQIKNIGNVILFEKP